MSVVCYDFSGKRQWMSFIEKFEANEHGNHSSMLLLEDRLIFFANSLVIVFDKKSGKELWRKKMGGYTDGISVPLTFKIDNEDAVLVPYSEAGILRVSDGNLLESLGHLGWIWSTPTIENGVAYFGGRDGQILIAWKMPT
jgi:outer membrane protein assembly factor BamB